MQSALIIIPRLVLLSFRVVGVPESVVGVPVGGIEFDGMNSCNSLSLMLRLVREAHAIAILPLPVLRELIADGTVRCLPASPSIQQVAYYASYVVDEADEDTFIVVDIAGSVLLKQRFITRLAEGAS